MAEAKADTGDSGAKLLLIGAPEALLREALGTASWALFEAPAADQGLRSLYLHRPDVVVLSTELPDRDGIELLGQIRAISQVPILALAPDEAGRLRALNRGADDCATRPSGRELAARILALLRRAPARDAAPLEDEYIRVDPVRHEASVGGESVRLTPTEFRMLAAFAANRGRVLRHRELLQLVWGDTHRGVEEVKLYVSYLRRKLAPFGVDPVMTVRGVGYRYEPRRLAGAERVPALSNRR